MTSLEGNDLVSAVKIHYNMLWTGNSFGSICLYVCICLSICMYVCNTVTFERLLAESLLLVCRCIVREYGGCMNLQVLELKGKV